MIYQGKGVPVREVILHCAAIKTGQFDRMSAFQVFAIIDRWHTERGFKNGFGYHGLIMPSGEWYSGRPATNMGAHVIGHNSGTLGVLLIESREITHVGQFSDWFTEEQRLRLREIVAKLRDVENVHKVSGHNDYAAKLCPGFKVKSADWL
jgi:N-acetylmuramoyl-L-alanine amidase